MRETNFIKQKHEKWLELERTMRQPQPDPEQLNDLFVQITDDLSFSRTYYPNRSVRVYLNGLAQQIFYSIYKNKKSSLAGFADFWAWQLPRIMYHHRQVLLLGMLLFWGTFLIGCLSGQMGGDGEFARQLLGDDYIDMTLANIQSGDPMAVYKDQSRFTMALTITLNNLMVCFRYFMFGALFTIGAILELLFFGLYVGAFQYFFFEQDALLPSLLGIWTHGSLEIPAAILSGVAGIVMGKGLVFPGTYSRMQSFLLSAKKGVQILIGTIPLILAAGFIEGYITRMTDAPDLLRAAFITLNFSIVLAYFVWLPYHRSTTNFLRHLPIISAIGLLLAGLVTAGMALLGQPGYAIYGMVACPALMYVVTQGYALLGQFEEKNLIPEREILPAPRNYKLRFRAVKSSGEIFTDAVALYQKMLPRISWAALGTSALFLALVLLLATGKPSDLFQFPSRFGDMSGTLLLDILEYGLVAGAFKFYFTMVYDITMVAGQFFDYGRDLLSPYLIANVATYSLLTHITLRALKKNYQQAHSPDGSKLPPAWRDWGKVAIVVLILNLLLVPGNDTGLFYFLYFLSFPFFLLWASVAVLEELGVVQAFARAWRLFFTRISHGFQLYLILGNISLLLLALVYSPVVMFLLRNFGYNILASQETMDEVLVLALVYICQTLFAFITPLLVLAWGLYYYSQAEVKDATHLMERIQLIGTQKHLRGMEREN